MFDGKNEDYRITLCPNIIVLFMTEKIKWHLISGEASKGNSVIAVVAGTGSAVAALIIGVVVVIVLLRTRMAKAKGIIAYFVVLQSHSCIYSNENEFCQYKGHSVNSSMVNFWCCGLLEERSY